jgi:hypothetical protein
MAKTHPTSPGTNYGLGPQPPRHDPYSARLHFHQSWYRAEILKAPFGTGPKASNKTFSGAMLTQEDGERGLNFLTPHIYQIARRRLAEKRAPIDSFRVLCNMLSEQSLAFNLFAPLVDNQDLAVRLMQALLPGQVQSVFKIYFEYIPEPANAYLNDRTSFHVFVDYTRPSGKPGFLGIVMSLAGASASKVVSSSAYKKWSDHPQAPFLPGQAHQFEAPALNQLWRSHLLALAMLLHPDSSYESGACLFLYPSHNPHGAEISARYRTILKPGQTTWSDQTLEALVENWAGRAGSSSLQSWLEAFKLRYLDLQASQPAT